MTDKEIIKALECCGDTDDGCLHCPLYGSPAPECGMRLCRESLALINRQQAEIERLKAKCENTQIGYNFAEDEIKNLKKDKYKLQKALNQSEDYRVIAKAEAVKEFAERLKKHTTTLFDWSEVVEISVDDLDDLVEEMVGEG